MKTITLLGLLLVAAFLNVYIFATFGLGCANVVQTRGGTICLDRAYMR